MPGMNGLDVLKALANEAPGVRVVMLTAAIEREETVMALRLGASGIVLKESATQMLYKCIRAVMNGEFWVGHERISDVMQSLRKMERAASGEAPPAERLTRRQFQVIAAVVDGASNKDIAAQLGVSEQTVKNQLSRIFDMLGVSSRLELALYAVHHRLLASGTASAGPKRGAGG
jgi:DNA-binding NarL/FixJ family response regulator